jgi:uncharacterized protein
VSGERDTQTIQLRTNLDEWVTVGRNHPLRFVVQEPAGGLKPYVLVRGRLEALVSRAVYLDLMALAETSSSGALGVWSGGIWWPFGSASAPQHA